MICAKSEENIKEIQKSVVLQIYQSKSGATQI